MGWLTNFYERAWIGLQSFAAGTLRCSCGVPLVCGTSKRSRRLWLTSFRCRMTTSRARVSHSVWSWGRWRWGTRFPTTRTRWSTSLCFFRWLRTGHWLLHGTLTFSPLKLRVLFLTGALKDHTSIFRRTRNLRDHRLSFRVMLNLRDPHLIPDRKCEDQSIHQTKNWISITTSEMKKLKCSQHKLPRSIGILVLWGIKLIRTLILLRMFYCFKWLDSGSIRKKEVKMFKVKVNFVRKGLMRIWSLSDDRKDLERHNYKRIDDWLGCNYEN